MAVKPIIDTVSILREALSSGHGAKYKRLAEALQARIQEGSLEGGAKLLPHRHLADRLGVTIGTVSRAYAELERMGLVVARIGDGTFVRQRDLERKRDIGFSNFVEERPEQFDMSRNMHIPGLETSLLAQSLADLARDPRRSRLRLELGAARPRRALDAARTAVRALRHRHPEPGRAAQPARHATAWPPRPCSPALPRSPASRGSSARSRG